MTTEKQMENETIIPIIGQLQEIARMLERTGASSSDVECVDETIDLLANYATLRAELQKAKDTLEARRVEHITNCPSVQFQIERDEARAALSAERERAYRAEAKLCESIADEHEAGYKRAVAELTPRIVALTEALRDYGRHNEGCSGPYGYPCKCGWDSAEIAALLNRTEGETITNERAAIAAIPSR